jgi:hypothetical protein
MSERGDQIMDALLFPSRLCPADKKDKAVLALAGLEADLERAMEAVETALANGGAAAIGWETTQAENARLVAALHDFANLLPPERWRLLYDDTNQILSEIQKRENQKREAAYTLENPTTPDSK